MQILYINILFIITSSNWGHHVVEYPAVSSYCIRVYGSPWEYVEMIPLASLLLQSQLLHQVEL